MKTSGNTILITGGGSGIGLELAREFKKLENRVIIAGRSKEKLAAAVNEGFATLTVDMMSENSIHDLAKQAVQDFPTLNVVIHNAGIMKPEDLTKGDNARTITDTVTTNLMGPMRLTEALLPHLLKQSHAAIMTVTSGLAYVPLAMTPTYCATKAGLHSYTESLRYQLLGTNVQVLELAPPYVQTELMRPEQANDPMAMPLKDFITEVMTIIKTEPQTTEVLVKRVHPLRFSASQGQESYQAFFKKFNDSMHKH